MIALLGRQDSPTDAVRDYCLRLGGALQAHGTPLQIAEVRWDCDGWPRAIAAVKRAAQGWRGECVLAQYTALAWSRRGLGSGFLHVLRVLRGAGARAIVVFHDARAAEGPRLHDAFRKRFQERLMRRVVAVAEVSIFGIPVEQITWLQRPSPNVHFIPIGSNIPPEQKDEKMSCFGERALRIGVFGITGSGRTSQEIQDIIAVARRVRQNVGPVSLHLIGRGVSSARSELEAALAGIDVPAEFDGILPAAQIASKLAACDTMLFVRGPLSAQRGSAIAGLACGLPIIAYAESELSFPLAEAGIEFAPWGDSDGLADAACRALSSSGHWRELCERSRWAYSKYFSWDRIAAQYLALLKP